jgi:hypothetical protein
VYLQPVQQLGFNEFVGEQSTKAQIEILSI